MPILLSFCYIDVEVQLQFSGIWEMSTIFSCSPIILYWEFVYATYRVQNILRIYLDVLCLWLVAMPTRSLHGYGCYSSSFSLSA